MRDEHISTANYAAVIADLRAKRDEIDRVIAALEGMILNRQVVLTAKRSEVPATVTSFEPKLPNGSGNNGIGEACARIVIESGGELTTRQVADRLIASGFQLDDRKNPINNVWSALSNRTKVAGDIEKVGKNWRPSARPYKGHQEAAHLNGAPQH